MGGPDFLERARCLVAVAATGARFLLPFASVFVLSAMIAHATEQALVDDLSYGTVEPTTQQLNSAAAITDVTGTAELHWVVLTYVGPSNQRNQVDCLTRTRARDAVLSDAEEMLRLTVDICQSTQQRCELNGRFDTNVVVAMDSSQLEFLQATLCAAHARDG